MSSRNLSMAEAISESTCQLLQRIPELFVMGEGVDDPKGAFGTTLEAFQTFGKERVFDTPLSESAVTGIAIGAAIEGRPSITVHLRSEFLLLAMDQIVNHAAKWHYMFGGKRSVPIVVRCIVGRGWGQAAQHSQSFHGMFAQVPGLKVIAPSNAYDAKGMLASAVLDPNPVIMVEHRWLHNKQASVPEELYECPLDCAKVVAEGKDITCIAVSHQVVEALEARESLLKIGIQMEVIDLRCLSQIDMNTISQSLRKTERVLLTDIATKHFGVCSEVAAQIAESGLPLRHPLVRITQPHVPTPCSVTLENEYYRGANEIALAAKRICEEENPSGIEVLPQTSQPKNDFHGPF